MVSAAKARSIEKKPDGDAAALQEQITSLTAELERTRALLETVEEWAQQSEDWARSTEAQLIRAGERISELHVALDAADGFRVENAALMSSRSWRVTAPFRGALRVARVSAKAIAKPVLGVGLAAARSNDGLRRRIRRRLSASPGLKANYPDDRSTSPGDAE